MIEMCEGGLKVSSGNGLIRSSVNFFRVTRHSSWIMMAAVICLMQTGCASLGSRSPEDVVRVRAQARWDALIAGKWEKAYEYATPGFRSSVDVFGFRSRVASPVKLKSAEVVSVDCKDTTCEATMRIGLVPLQKGYPETTTDLTERWVQEGGEWWRFERY